MWDRDAHGMPATRTARALDPSTLERVRFITVAMPDAHGALRGKTLTRAEFDSALERGRIPMPEIILTLDTEDAPTRSLPFGVSAGSRDLLLRLEPDTFVALPWREGWGLCLGTPLWPTLEPCEYGGRVVLQRALDALAPLGLSARVAFEYEVIGQPA